MYFLNPKSGRVQLGHNLHRHFQSQHRFIQSKLLMGAFATEQRWKKVCLVSCAFVASKIPIPRLLALSCAGLVEQRASHVTPQVSWPEPSSSSRLIATRSLVIELAPFLLVQDLVQFSLVLAIRHVHTILRWCYTGQLATPIRNACFSHEFVDMLHILIAFKDLQRVAALQISQKIVHYGCYTSLFFGNIVSLQVGVAGWPV